MLDTILLKLNNVSKYPATKLRFQSQSTSGETSFMVDEDTGEVTDSSKIRAIMYHDSDTIIPLSKRASLHIASSNYVLSYFYNITGDFITFEFSIPKYIWGTNIIQFVEYFSQDVDTIYKKLHLFVRGFFAKHCFEKIDLVDIELNRLDLCYNQFFMSKLDALKYLSEQKALLQKHSRSSKNRVRTYDTSLVYVTKRYSFKIYHKGEEFKVNDRKELAKKNATGHQISELQAVADRILRYEVTFRKSQIDYLYERDQLHTKYLGFMKTESGLKSMRLLNRRFYEDAMYFVENSKHFIFGDIKAFEAIETQSVYFDKAIFGAMFTFFWDTVKKYQLTRKKSLTEVVSQIHLMNERRDKAVSKTLREKLSFNEPMLVTLCLLTEHKTLAEIRMMNVFSKTTFYKYQAKLRELGVDDECRLTDIPPPELDYSDYKYIFGKHHLI